MLHVTNLKICVGAEVSQTRYKVRQGSESLRPNLVRCGVKVRLPIGRIAVSVGIVLIVWMVCANLAHATNRSIRVCIARSDHKLCPIRGQDSLSFVRGAFRQTEFDRAAKRCSNHRVDDAGVAAGGVDNRFSTAKRTARPCNLGGFESDFVTKRRRTRS